MCEIQVNGSQLPEGAGLERPGEAVEIQAGTDVGIFRDVKLIVESEKVVMGTKAEKTARVIAARARQIHHKRGGFRFFFVFLNLGPNLNLNPTPNPNEFTREIRSRSRLRLRKTLPGANQMHCIFLDGGGGLVILRDMKLVDCHHRIDSCLLRRDDRLWLGRGGS